MRFVEPPLIGTILISGRGFDSFYACLHGAGRFALVAQARVGAAHKVERFRIGGPVVQKTFEGVPRIFVLSGCIVGCSYLAPYFVLAVSRIPRNDLLEILNRVTESLLRPRNAPQLVMRVNLFSINLDCTLETLTRRIKFTPV